jgi:hypothetical protein
MLAIIKEHNTIHRRADRPVVQSSPDLSKIQLHTVSVVGIRSTGEPIDIQISINAYILNYGPCIYYDIISNIPYKKDEWLEHPFKDLRLENSIEVGDHIDDTPTTRKILEDIIIPDNWKKYISSAGYYDAKNIKSVLHNTVIDMIGHKEDYETGDTIEVNLKLRVNVLQLDNNQLGIKISTNYPIKDGERWDLHPFRMIDSNKEKTSYSGILNDTHVIRQMIDDLVSPVKRKLYVTYDINYRAHLIGNLYKLFLTPNTPAKTKCKIINDLIICLGMHWS